VIGTAAFLLLLVFVPLVAEAARARRNELAQFARGGIEPRGDVYTIMRVAYPGAFLAMIAEGWLRGFGGRTWFVAGAALFLAAKLLKWWAIVSLGSAWTFRVIVVPHAPLVSSGPYRLVRHPNYVAVIGELFSVALMTGAAFSGPVMTVLFGFLILRRIKVEERALRS
jgi:methyltransferase